MTLDVFEVTVATVYSLSMAKYVFVQFVGREQPAKIKGDVVEQAGGEMFVKLGQTVVGQFRRDQVQGWWIEEEHGR
jgi:hypothetical protein